MYLDGAVKARGCNAAFFGIGAASPVERKQKMQCLPCENAQRRHCIFGILGGMQTEPAHSAARHAP